MKFVAVSDVKLEQDKKFTINDEKYVVRVPRSVQLQDVVVLILNSGSTDPQGNPRKELRVYTMPPDPSKPEPTFRFGECVPDGARLVFEFPNWGYCIYTFAPLIENPLLHKVRDLLRAEETDPQAVFSAFDTVIFKMSKKGTLPEDTEILYEKASKCKARMFATPFEPEAELSFKTAVLLLSRIVGLKEE